jgi:hypothetical protein
MIDTLRSEFPADMTRAAANPSMGSFESMAYDVMDHLKDYSREHPAAFGLWALGIGFVLGWKLKPW